MPDKITIEVDLPQEPAEYVMKGIVKKGIPLDRLSFIWPSKNNGTSHIKMSELMNGLKPYSKYEFIKSNNQTVSINSANTIRRKDKLATAFNSKLAELLEGFFDYEENDHTAEDVKLKLEGTNTAWKNWLNLYSNLYYYNKAEGLFMSRVNFLLFLRAATKE